MRILAGHIFSIPEVVAHRPLPGREAQGGDMIAFGRDYRQIATTPGMTWKELLAACPPGWQPDIYLHWAPEYHAIPDGMERADCLTVGIVGDWNLGGQTVRNIGSAFDVLFADRGGVERLQKMGLTQARYAPLWAFDPALHRRLPPAETPERDLDIVMVGNFNHHVQQERARWLARVARLSDRYRVLLTSGVYGEEYTRLLNRARIVFNRSIRGEINMRAYEAPACGALLFYEAENPEIGELFADGVECVLYTAENLEDRLAYYLAAENRAEREAIAAAGWRKVQSHTYAHHLARMLTQIESEDFRRKMSPAMRAFNCLSDAERIFRKAAHEAQAGDYLAFGAVEARLTELAAQVASDPGSEDVTLAEIANLQAVLLGKWAAVSPVPQREATYADAIRQAQTALLHDPAYLLARCNLGHLYSVAGHCREADMTLRACARQLKQTGIQTSHLSGLLLPRGWDYVDVERERLAMEREPGSDAWHEAMIGLLRTRVYTLLMELAVERGDLTNAVPYGIEAVTAAPASGEAGYLLARALRMAGHGAEAVALYRAALELSPLTMDAWRELAQLLLDLQQPEAAADTLNEAFAILNGSPYYDALRPGFAALQRQINL